MLSVSRWPPLIIYDDVLMHLPLQPQGPLVVGILNPPLFKPRGFLTRYLPLGTFFNTFYNFSTTRVTYQGLADYMIDHLDLDSRIKGKRIGILEDPSAVLKGK